MIKRPLFWYLGIALILIGMTWFSLTDPNVRPWVFTAKNQPDFLFTNLRAKQLDQGKTVWAITSKKAAIFKQKEQLKIELSEFPSVSFFFQDIAYQTKGKHFLFFLPEQKLIGSGQVSVISEALFIKGERLHVNLQTEQLRIYDQAHARLTLALDE